MPFLSALSAFPIATGPLAAAGPSVFVYFGQSNTAGKGIIVVLVLLSLVAWTVMIGKWLESSRMRTQNLGYERRLSKETRILALDPQHPGSGAGPYRALVREGLEAFYRYGIEHDSDDPHRTTLRMGHVENALQRGVAEQTVRYESKMVLLGSIVTGAPFLGLLGTVWGVMDAFGGISASGGATLQNLAPGVSGALLTTVLALVVAIPSVFGYNYLLQQVKIGVVELENFASTVADRIELEAQAGLG